MPKRNLAWVLIIAMITLMMWQLPQTIAGRDSVYKAFGPLVDVRSQIHKRFVDEVNDEELVDVGVEAGIRAMIEKLHDPHALYLSPAEYSRFKNRTEGVFGGIGVDVWETPKGLEVLSRAANSPAVAAGILPGDIITEVDEHPTRQMSLVDAVNNYLNGAPGSEVQLTLLRAKDGGGAATLNIKVQRAIIHIDAVRGWSRGPSGDWRFMIDPEARIAYVRLTKFTQDVAEQLDARVEPLLAGGLRGLVLDLRDNTGGLFDSAREVADRFLENGLIVRTSGRRTDEKQWFAMHEGTYPQFPMVVLINGSTASAAEIVAGALRDHERAIVVGERSYGKGSVQEVVELDRQNGAIKLTTAYYYLPCGQCINRTAKNSAEGNWGVAPNVTVNMKDPQRERCLAAWREISREMMETATTQATTAPSEPESDRERQDAAKRLLEADTQLGKAVELLRQRLRPAGTTTLPATGPS